MTEAMTENWESQDAAENWETAESYGESAESAESAEAIDNRRRWRGPQPNRFRATPGVRGIVMRGPGGTSQTVRFPAPLATAEQTNRHIATQDAARRALEERLERLETKYRAQMKTDSAITGFATLGIGGILTAYGIFQSASQTANGSRLGDWASRESTHIAAVVSATQLATTLAKVTMRGYPRSYVHAAADIFSVLQLSAFAFASFYKPGQIRAADDFDAATKDMANVQPGTLYVVKDTGNVFEVDLVGGARLLRRVA